MEFESFQSGNLLYIGLKEGESAIVVDLFAIDLVLLSDYFYFDFFFFFYLFFVD